MHITRKRPSCLPRLLLVGGYTRQVCKQMRVRARVHSVRNQTVKSSWYVAEELVTEDRIATISSKCLQVFKRR